MNYQELNSVWILKKTFDRESRRLEDLRALAEPTTPLLDGMPRSATPVQTSKVESIATLIVDAERALVRLSEEIEAAKCRVLVALQSVPMKELALRVLRYHYAGCKSFSAIAKILHYSKWYVMDLHDAGLEALGLDVRTMIQFKKTL